MAEKPKDNNTAGGYQYPFTKMNFVVSTTEGDTDGISSVAAFTEVTGVEATAEVIEFRQGNSQFWSPAKLPGLVKHGNVTFKLGYITSSSFLSWAHECVSDSRGEVGRKPLTIELLSGLNSDKDVEGVTWVLNDAWVTKYSAPDLNSTANEVAIATMEVAYETITLPATAAPKNPPT